MCLFQCREAKDANLLRAADLSLESEAPLYSFVLASDLSENRFALFGLMLARERQRMLRSRPKHGALTKAGQGAMLPS
jgi:hypothetical protein